MIKASKAFGGSAKTTDYEFEICGHHTPFVKMFLEPGKGIIAQPGTFMSKTTGVTMEMVLGNGEKQGLGGKLWGAAMRKLSGDNVLLSHFHNAAAETQTLFLAAPQPGEVIAVDLAETGAIKCKRGAFMAAPAGTDISVAINTRLTTGLFAGEGFIMQKISGNQHAFLSAGGDHDKCTLGEGESIQIDTGCLLAASDTVDIKVELVKNVGAMIFGQEGLFLATLEGPGDVWMQSMPFSRQVAQMGEALEPRFKKTLGAALGRR